MPTELLERQLTGQMLRVPAGNQTWCPSGQELLVVGHAVAVELLRGDDLIGTLMICATSADAGAVRRAYRARRGKNPDFTLRTIDGL